MLADHVGVDAARVHLELLPDQRAQPARVQHRAGADDATGWETGDFERGVGQHVYRVGDDQQDGVRRGRGHLRDDALDDLGVAAHQFEARLAGFLRCACGDDDHRRVGAIFIGAAAHGDGPDEGRTVRQVHRFAFDAVRVHVHEDDLGCEAAVHDGVGGGGPHGPGPSDDADFGRRAVFGHVSLRENPL